MKEEMQRLVDNLSEEKFEALRGAVSLRAEREAETRARDLSLSESEMETFYLEGKIPAVKEFRNRTGCSLRVALKTVNNYEKSCR